MGAMGHFLDTFETNETHLRVANVGEIVITYIDAHPSPHQVLQSLKVSHNRIPFYPLSPTEAAIH